MAVLAVRDGSEWLSRFRDYRLLEDGLDALPSIQAFLFFWIILVTLRRNDALWSVS